MKRKTGATFPHDARMNLPRTFHPDSEAEPYRANPASLHRVKFDARVDFTNGGYVEAREFLLDIEGDSVSPERLAEMIVSAMNLLRAGPVTIFAMAVVRRGEHQDAVPETPRQRS